MYIYHTAPSLDLLILLFEQQGACVIQDAPPKK